VRHNAVFHFDVDIFRETIEKGGPGECLFISGSSRVRSDIHYAYADIISAEILVGQPAMKVEFNAVLGDAAAKTDKLVTDFVQHAEALISSHLPRWGFTVRTVEPT